MSLGNGMTLRDTLALTKFTISSVSTLSAAAGYVAAHKHAGAGLVPLALGTLLLAMGASAWNEIQERGHDARMNRTRARPLPQGAVSPLTASLLAALLCLGGAGLLRAVFGWIPCLLGLGALGWYALVYTPLKRVTFSAILPGALIGALPPAMGWSAAGGSLGDPGILAIALVFLLWQVPHFWLLALLHQEDYARAGFPTFPGPPATLRKRAFAWICGTVAACGLLPASGTVGSLPALALLAATAILSIQRATRLLRAGPNPDRQAFRDLNLLILAVMAALLTG